MRLLYVSIGLLGLLAAALTINVGLLRGRKKINLGDGGDPEMRAAIRAHGNFMEFVPLSLILILTVMDHYGGPTAGIMAVVLLAARVAHAGGMLGYIPRGRLIGAVTTTALLVATSVCILLVVLGAKPH